MVLYGLTVQVFGLTDSSTSVSLLLLTFLVPAVIFGAIAGVLRRPLRPAPRSSISTNVARGAAVPAPRLRRRPALVILYVVTAIVATLTTFFAPGRVGDDPAGRRRAAS